MASAHSRPFRTSIRTLDLSFAILALTGSFAILSGPDAPFAAESVAAPLVVGIVAIAGTVVLTVLASVAAAFDRRSTEDYAHQLIANAAVIGLLASFAMGLIWNTGILTRAGVPPPSVDQFCGVMMLAWACGYSVYRVRGFTA